MWGIADFQAPLNPLDSSGQVVDAGMSFYDIAVHVSQVAAQAGSFVLVCFFLPASSLLLNFVSLSLLETHFLVSRMPLLEVVFHRGEVGRSLGLAIRIRCRSRQRLRLKVLLIVSIASF